MSTRKTPFVNNEFYHIYNRGIDKRSIVGDARDVERFMQSIGEFNALEPIGSIYEKHFADKKFGSLASKTDKNELEKLVNIVAYCLNQNHYHFILEQLAEKGIEKFMHRLGTGYTKYFNNKHKRTGSLFQGKFKSIHVSSNEYLLHLSVYVNLNNRIHKFGSKASKFMSYRSSWDEYIRNEKSIRGLCVKDIVLNQFDGGEDYQKFAEDSFETILIRKELEKELEEMLLE